MASETALNYKQLFINLPERYMVVAADDPDFTIADQSLAHARISSVKRENTLGKPILEVYPDTSGKYRKTGVSDLIESFRKVIKTGKPDAMDNLRYDLRNAQGKYETRYWSVEHFPLFDDKGKVTHIFQVTKDITSETVAEQQLERSRAQLEEVLGLVNIGTWSLDLQGNTVRADRNLARLFNITPQEAAGGGLTLDAFINAVHAEDRSRVKKEITKAIKNNLPYETEYRTIAGDGTQYWVIARGSVKKNESGEPERLSGVLIDITERKQAENKRQFMAQSSAALAESLDYKKTLKKIAKLVVPNIADWCAIDMLDERGEKLQQVALAHKDPKKVRWGKELRKQQGSPELDEPTGTPAVIRSGKPEFYPKITEEFLRSVVQDPAELELVLYMGLSAIIMVPLRVEEKVVGVITLASTDGHYYNETDLQMATELAERASLAMTNAHLFEQAKRELAKRVRLEEQLRQANEELEARVKERTHQLEILNVNLNRSNQELQDFAYVASHDLQEPLRKIQAFGNLLEQEYAEQLGDGRDYLERMRNAAARMSSLIGDLLSFSRVTTKAQAFVPVDLNLIAQEVLSDLETRVAETEGRVVIKKLPKLDADPLQMRQLFQNLLSNALKFHREGVPPVITVSASSKTMGSGKIKHSKILVKDNGVGFDEKYLDRIFAVFQRLYGREVYEGTGIGLAVCRKIVERHNGTITATSAPGQGSTFIITLPLKHTSKGAKL